jgi:hypothetical protein
MSTLLQGVNAVLKKVHIIQGDSGDLTSFTDSSRQVFIDIALQSWNEMIDELYTNSISEKPEIWTSNTISLVNGTRTYALQTDVIELHWPFQDQTNGRYIREYPGTYLDLIRSQDIPANFTGTPNYGVLDPTASAPQIYLDRVPTASDDGNSYTYYYQKDPALSATTDVLPFSEGVYRALIPAVAEIWRRHQHKDFDDAIFRSSMGRAAKLMNMRKQRDAYHANRYIINREDPFTVTKNAW